MNNREINSAPNHAMSSAVLKIEGAVDHPPRPHLRRPRGVSRRRSIRGCLTHPSQPPRRRRHPRRDSAQSQRCARVRTS